jgi:alpha-tubulin suppressor-like RCC1 family protein
MGLPAGVTAITAGAESTCAIANGAAYCWGADGQIGNSAVGDKYVPYAVMGLPAAVPSVQAGATDHACAIVNGAAFCWGDNFYGQLGTGARDKSGVPVAVVGSSGLTGGVTAISPGGEHTCAVANGAAYCWGYNYLGDLGNNSLIDSWSPVPVMGLASGVTEIAAGGYSSCAIANDVVSCWGANVAGQLGNKSNVNNSQVPVPVTGLTSRPSLLAAGNKHACVAEAGFVRCWGDNEYGQLGNNSVVGSNFPVTVQGLPSAVSAIAAGAWQTCAITGGVAYCWGSTPGPAGVTHVPVAVKVP